MTNVLNLQYNNEMNTFLHKSNRINILEKVLNLNKLHWNYQTNWNKKSPLDFGGFRHLIYNLKLYNFCSFYRIKMAFLWKHGFSREKGNINEKTGKIFFFIETSKLY